VCRKVLNYTVLLKNEIKTNITANQQRIAILTSNADSLCNFRGPLICEWISHGLDVYALAPDFDDESKSAVLALGAIPVDIHMSRTGRNPIADLRTLISLVFLFRKLKLDMVFCYYIKPVIYGMLAARIVRIQQRFALIAGAGYMHSGQQKKTPIHTILSLIVNWICRRGLFFADMVFFQNRNDQQEFIRLNLVNENNVAITGGTGVDFSAYEQIKPATAPQTFILVARLLVEKGVREYAVAIGIVKTKYPNTRFILLGGLDPSPNGLSQSEVDGWVKDGILEWPGEVKNVIPWLKKSSVFVLPSYREGVPRSTQEAMAIGLPVITCDTVGCRETVIEGKTGFLVEHKNPESLANAMIYFIENPEEMALMGNAGRKFAEERYDVHKINQKILQSMGIHKEE